MTMAVRFMLGARAYRPGAPPARANDVSDAPKPIMTRAPVRVGPFRRLVVAALAIVSLSPAATADEVRMLDGRVLVGKVTEKGGNLEIVTRDGTVVVANKDVAERRRDPQLRERLAEMARTAGDTTFAHLNLAMQARTYGLEPELWRHLDRALALRAQVPADAAESLQRRLADFLAQLGPELLPLRDRGASTKVRVHKLLGTLRGDGGTGRSDSGTGRAAAVEELLVRETNADEDLRREARSNDAPAQRIGAIRALRRRALAGNDQFVLRTAILDRSEDVRHAAIGLCRATTTADDVTYLASGLAHGNAKVRVRTAEALAELGHPDAVQKLVLAGPFAAVGLAAADGGASLGNRAHVAFLEQQAYIRDFDVEVAAQSFIADPQVGVLQSGSVLDVTVFGVYEETTIVQAYRVALKKLTQQDPGAQPAGWPAWLANLRRQQGALAPSTAPR